MTNCVYIFGNGFDLRMGMPTSYPDFLKYYEGIKTPDYTVASIKQSFLSKVKIEKGQEWKDLDIALGLFTKDVFDVESFKDFYRDISSALKEYLTLAEENLPNLSPDDEIKFWEDLMFPEDYIHVKSRKKVFDIYSHKDKVTANIINFNYTNTLEHLLSSKKDVFNGYGDSSRSSRFWIRDIKHVHGKLNESDLLFGVNDLSQIENEDFCMDENFQDLIIKPKGNEELGTGVDTECASLISEADIFYIYGTSLGPTDKLWWDCILHRFMNSNAILLYFHYTSQKVKKDLLERDYIGIERELRKLVMERIGIEGDIRSFRDRIFVARNTDIFPIYPKRMIIV